jgi:hypothetical protein
MRQTIRRRRIPLLGMALLGLVIGVMIGGGSFVSAASTGPSVADYSQCANGKPGTANPQNCNGGWINGILNANNSQYSEDQVTAQRLVVDFPLAGSHSFDLRFLVRKANNHAYDSLATWNYTETGAQRCDGFHGTALSNCTAATGGTPSTTPITADDLVVTSSCTTASTTTSDHQLAGQELQMFGGTLVGMSYTGTAADTEGLYQLMHVTFTTAAPNTRVYFYFGGHLAAGLGSRAWGTGCGSSSINGGPYHIKVDAVDDASAGNRDNQITSGAIIAQTPSINTTPSNTGHLTFSEDLNDSVTLGGGATGNVTFSLYDTQANCLLGGTTGLLYTKVVAAVAGSASTTDTGTATGSNNVTASGDYYWSVHYAGDGSLNLPADSTCAEHSSFTAPTLPTVTNTGA